MNVGNEPSDPEKETFDDLVKKYQLFKKKKTTMPNINVQNAIRWLWGFNFQKLSFYGEKTLPILLSVAVNSTLQLLRSNRKYGKVTFSKYEEDIAALKPILQYFKPINKDDPLESTEVYDFTNLNLDTYFTQKNDRPENLNNSTQQMKRLLEIYNRNFYRKKKWWRTRFTHWGGKRARLHQTKKRRKKMNGPRKNSFYQ